MFVSFGFQKRLASVFLVCMVCISVVVDIHLFYKSIHLRQNFCFQLWLCFYFRVSKQLSFEHLFMTWRAFTVSFVFNFSEALMIVFELGCNFARDAFEWIFRWCQFWAILTRCLPFVEFFKTENVHIPRGSVCAAQSQSSTKGNITVHDFDRDPISAMGTFQNGVNFHVGDSRRILSHLCWKQRANSRGWEEKLLFGDASHVKIYTVVHAATRPRNFSAQENCTVLKPERLFSNACIWFVCAHGPFDSFQNQRSGFLHPSKCDSCWDENNCDVSSFDHKAYRIRDQSDKNAAFERRSLAHNAIVEPLNWPFAWHLFPFFLLFQNSRKTCRRTSQITWPSAFRTLSTQTRDSLSFSEAKENDSPSFWAAKSASPNSWVARSVSRSFSAARRDFLNF